MCDGLSSDREDRPGGYQETMDFWSIYDSCGVSDTALASEVTQIRNAVTDCIYIGDYARAMSLTMMAMLMIGKFDDL